MKILEDLEKSTQYIRSKTQLHPKLGLILGSGLGAFAEEIEIDTKIPFSEIPGFIPPTVIGHSGALVIGHIDKTPVAVLQGRVHYYEGHSMTEVVHPIRTLGKLGIESLLITNSAGGMADGMTPGDFMLISDHINLMGSNPLIGPSISELGPRFPDMTEVYNHELRAQLKEALKTNSVRAHEGVYCGLSGPTYETPAEIRMLQTLGGSAVGMSTVPEAIAANHMGIKVCGMSCITNLAAGISSDKLSHDEVTDIASKVEKTFCQVLRDFAGNFSL